MDVSVIMINYNTFDLTKDALESIFAQTQGLAYEIILVDNLSPDGSGERLRDLFGDRIIYLQSGGNLGTSKAFNLGLRHATGKYILWLNTDILIKENFIKKLFDYMESDPKCGICGGNVLDFQGKPSGSCADQFTTLRSVRLENSILHRIVKKISKRRKDYNYSDESKEVAWINGAEMMARHEVIDKIGGLDEIIFMYAEEMEFSYRMHQLTDYSAVSVPWAHIYHLEGASSKEKTIKFNEEWERQILLGLPRYFYKWYGEETVYKYLKLRISFARKMQFLSFLLFDRGRTDRYKRLKYLYKEHIKNFQLFIKKLSGEE